MDNQASKPVANQETAKPGARIQEKSNGFAFTREDYLEYGRWYREAKKKFDEEEKNSGHRL
ncbi:MAG: hypothetical protein QM537_03405 [Candidatus Symbiobacter sp.]|nr:hypothetical protein [Candidatus Symbiobacter sp.]